MAAAVKFMCVAPGHEPKNLAPGFGLTVYQREWAFCGAGASTAGHQWQDCGGVDPSSAITALGRFRESAPRSEAQPA